MPAAFVAGVEMLHAPPWRPAEQDDLPESPWSRLAGALLSAATRPFQAAAGRDADREPNGG